MISLNNYDTLGQNGMAMMQNSMNTANAASNQILESGADPMAIAEASMGRNGCRCVARQATK